MGFPQPPVLPPEIQAIADFEAGWDARMGGSTTQELRWMIGIALARLTELHDVHPRELADYVRESLRIQNPARFDAS